MNRQFYDFLGHVFLNAAQSQDTLDAITVWMKQGFSGMAQFTEIFQRCYGLQTARNDPREMSAAWQKAMNDFQQAFTQFAHQWGWVSQSEHQKLVDKCAQLEKMVSDQQATIAQLRGLMARKGIGYTELFEHFNNALEDQGKQFQALMASMRSPADKSS